MPLEDYPEFFGEMVELSADHIRHVATTKGMEYFGLPIGSPITKAQVMAAKAAHALDGKLEPKGGVVSAKEWETHPNNPEATTADKVGSEADKLAKGAKQDVSNVGSKLTVTDSTISGNQHFNVAGTDYTAPEGSTLIKSKTSDGIAYVRTPDGEVHTFVRTGEVKAADPFVAKALASKFGPSFQGDDQYEVSDFAKGESESAFENLPVGQKLVDADGNAIFHKTSDNQWQHEGTGVQVADKDVQGLVEDGSLKTAEPRAEEAKTPKAPAKPYGEMDDKEFNDTLTSHPEGHTLLVGSGDSAAKLTKQRDGSWKTEGAKEGTPNLQNENLKFIKSALSDHDAKAEARAAKRAEKKAAAEKEAKKAEAEKARIAELPKTVQKDYEKSEDKTSAPRGADTPVKSNQLFNLPNGTPLITQNGSVYIKHEDAHGNAMFTRKSDDLKLGINDIAPLADGGKLHTYIDPGYGLPKGSQFAATSPQDNKAFLDTLKPGDKFGWAPSPGESASIFTVSKNEKVVAGSGDIYDKKDFIPQDNLYKLPQDDTLSNNDFLDTVKSKLEEPEPEETKVGALVDAENLDKLPKGAIVSASETGGVQYTALGHNEFLSSNGNIYPKEAFGGKLHLLSTPEDSLSKGYKYKPGDKIEKYGDLKDLPTGTTISWNGLEATKTDAGTFEVPGYSDPKYSALEPDELALGIKSQSLSLQSYPTSVDPSVEHASEDAADAAVETAKNSNPTQLFNGGPSVTQSDLEDSIKALEGHSGFQVAYAQKNMADDNPLKDTDTMQAVVNHAMSLHSGDKVKPKPKSAVLAYLKAKAGIKDTTEEDNAPKITIGSGSPKSTKQGANGGEFSEKEISDAINILEGSDSKFIKSTLDKKGNALGKLDPSAIVGINKDKTVTKQNFLDTLKDKLAKLQGQESSSSAEPSVGVSTSNVAEAVKEEGPVKIQDFESFKKLPAGSVVNYKGDAYSTDDIYTKSSDGVWVDDHGNEVQDKNFTPAIESGSLSLVKSGDEPEEWEKALMENSSPEPAAPKLTGTVQSPQELLDAPIGTEVTFKGSTGNETKYFKKGVDDWKTPGNGASIQAKNFTSAIEKGNVTYSGGESDESKSKYLGNSDLDSLPVGSVVHSEALEEDLTKKADGKWYLPGQDKGYSRGNVSNQVVTLKSSPSDEPKVGDKLDTEALDKLPVGAQIESTGDTQFYKHSDGKWSYSASVNEPGQWDAKSVSTYSAPTFVSMTSKAPDEPAGIDVLPEENYLEPGDVLSADEMDILPTGSAVKLDDPKNFMHGTWYKHEDGMWAHSQELDKEGTLSSSYLQEQGDIALVSQPTKLPSYAETPTAVSSKTNNILSAEEKADPSIIIDGTTLYDPNDKSHVFVKDYNGAVEFKNGEYQYGIGNAGLKQSIEDLGLEKQSTNIDFNKSDLLPGKYIDELNGGKGVMYVNADGTGSWTQFGSTKALSPEGVKNYHKHAPIYVGVSNNAPAPSVKAADVDKPKYSGEMPKNFDGNLPDGIYYGGSPSNYKTPIYKMVDGKLKVYKAAAIPPNSGTKKGGKLTNAWLDGVGEGASFNLNYSHGSIPADTYIKEGSGDWIGKKTSTALSTDNVKSISSWYTTIESHGTGEPMDVTPTKLKSLLKGGKLLDDSGSSIVPKGHTGDVTFFGVNTNIPNLVQAKKQIDALPEGHSQSEFAKALAGNGVAYDSADAAPYLDAHYGKHTSVYLKQGLQDKLNQLVDGAVVPSPEKNSAGDLFELDEMGNPVIPADVLAKLPDTNMMPSDHAIEAISESLGGKPSLAPGATYEEKKNWVNAYKAGDFAKMYDIEALTYAKANKPHPGGHLHPGSSVNPLTNKITWAPTVKGEIPAGEKIPGEWSSNASIASPEELDNYLISAQMQNPTFLGTDLKRQWVDFHQKGDAFNTNKISALAQARKDAGMPPVTEAPVWTDNVEPAKSYTPLFDSTPYPTVWTTAQAADYLKDNIAGDPELQQTLHDVYQEATGTDLPMEDMPNMDWYNSNVSSVLTDVLGKHFANQQALQAIEDAKPLYVLHPQKSTHWHTGIHASYPILNSNPSNGGDEWVFKPLEPDNYFKTDGKWRTDTEIGAGVLGKMLGFNTPEIKGIELDPNGGGSKYGSMQKMADVTGSLTGQDLSNLTDMQVADLATEHVLDHLLEQDDTWSDNVLLTSNGHLIGIDKGRAFATYGANWTTEMNPFKLQHNSKEFGEPTVDTPMVYDKLYSAMGNGSISKEKMDAAYKSVMNKARMVQKRDSSVLENTLRDYLKDRPAGAFNLNYKIGDVKVDNSLDGLVAAFLDRKSKIADDFDKMWDKIYTKAGYEKPEVPDNPFLSTGHHNALDSVAHHEDVFKHGALGASTIVGGDHFFHNGTALQWLEHNKTDDKDKNTLTGKGQLDMGVGKDLYAYLSQNATTVGSAVQDAKGTAVPDQHWGNILNAAKTVSKHAADGQYNTGYMQALDKSITDMDKDLKKWNDGGMTPEQHFGESVYNFPSGAKVPEDSVGQFLKMLTKYKKDSAGILDAQSNKKTAPNVTQFSPISLEPPKQTYVNDTGDKLHEFADGTFSYHSASGEFEDVPSDDAYVSDAKASINGWHGNDKPSLAEDVTNKPKITYTPNSTHNTEAVFDPATKTKQNLAPNNKNKSDAEQGGEFTIELPTGEKIYFRDTQGTSTALTQWNQLQWQAPNVGSAEESSAAMSRVIGYLQSLGFNLSPADHTDAELAYWEEMADQLLYRNRNTSATQKAGAALDAKMKELGSTKFDLMHDLRKNMTTEQLQNFWRSAWAEGLGKEKVDDWIAKEKYLPSTGQTNIDDLSSASGLYRHRRIDVDLADVLKSGKTVATSTRVDQGGPNASLDYYKYTGAELPNQEQWRILGRMPHYHGSAGTDLQNGGGDTIFSAFRSTKNGGKSFDWKGWYGENNVIWDPSVVTYTGFYGNNYDAYGNQGGGYGVSGNTPDSVIFDKSGYTDVDIPKMGTLLNDIAMYVLRYDGGVGSKAHQDAVLARQQFLDHLHSLGINEIRGLPIEDRIVMKENREAALAKVIASWQQ